MNNVFLHHRHEGLQNPYDQDIQPPNLDNGHGVSVLRHHIQIHQM